MEKGHKDEVTAVVEIHKRNSVERFYMNVDTIEVTQEDMFALTPTVTLKGNMKFLDDRKRHTPKSRNELKKILNSIYGTSSVNNMGIKDVIFKNPATIVLWNDGTKTVVKCQEGDTYSKEHGLAMAICKKVCGNNGAYNNVFKKWIPESKD